MPSILYKRLNADLIQKWIVFSGFNRCKKLRLR